MTARWSRPAATGLLAAVFVIAGPTSAAPAQAQLRRVVEWVEYAPADDTERIALGYPVPIPVDTPLPFDGFRSYAGLHMRHQDLAATTPWVRGVEIGQTRAGRTIRAYRLGDSDHETVYGLPEHAMLSNGGIHAREWQTPEVATGIMELLALAEPDRHLVDYLRDNANILVIPVLNVDGFLQTQRFPRHNWLGTDISYPLTSPRDGRMRRKNMLGVDEALETQVDHLQGIDLNRNNDPFWATSTRSSWNSSSLVHHGAAPASEPETQALDAAAQLGPAARLSMYTDIHSFTQVSLWDRNGNLRLARLTERLLDTFSAYHQAFPAGKYYYFDPLFEVFPDFGIGTTAEYFTHVYQVPSWTLEIEPSGGEHPGLPGAGADYGGLGRNSHDGFILPESEIARVRNDMARTFAVAYYQQSGPPSVTAVRLVDRASGAVVFDAEWDVVDAERRELFRNPVQAVQLGRDYEAWVAFDKPMRWREAGAVVPLPGKSGALLEVTRALTSGDGDPVSETGPTSWLAEPGDAPLGALRYRDDAMTFGFRLPPVAANQLLAATGSPVTLEIDAMDLVGTRTDANPATVAHWRNGAWSGYENTAGADGTDSGGTDATIAFPITAQALGDPFTVEPGTSSAWFDPDRDGEGFMLEILPDDRSVMYWFTYDDEGRQDWYTGIGEIRGNRIIFPELLRVSGGVFGPGFDPAAVTRDPVGSATFIWSSCDAGTMKWVLDDGEVARRQGRMNLSRLSSVLGVECGRPSAPLPGSNAFMSGSWFDPARSGEGYTLEILADGRTLVFWFTYDASGQRRWFYGVGSNDDERLVFDPLYTTAGARFGAAFEPADMTLTRWGRLELELDCEAGTARFESEETGFPAGQLDLVPLTRLAGLHCDS